MKTLRTTRTSALVALSLALCGLVGYQFISAQSWTDAPTVPPLQNTLAPINTGPANQDKSGVLGALGLVAFGGGMKIVNSAPSVTFDDASTDNNIWWLHSNAYNGSKGRIHFLYDRNNNGEWDGGDIYPSAIFESGETPDEDFAQFSNQVRANQYCNADGSVCFTADQARNTLPSCTPGQTLVADSAGQWVCGPSAPVTPPAVWLVNNQHTERECQAYGGVVTSDGSSNFCRLNLASCPTGWTQFSSWDQYQSRSITYCSGSGVACTTGSSPWGNTTTVPSCSYWCGGDNDNHGTRGPFYATRVSIGCY